MFLSIEPLLFFFFSKSRDADVELSAVRSLPQLFSHSVGICQGRRLLRGKGTNRTPSSSTLRGGLCGKRYDSCTAVDENLGWERGPPCASPWRGGVLPVPRPRGPLSARVHKHVRCRGARPRGALGGWLMNHSPHRCAGAVYVAAASSAHPCQAVGGQQSERTRSTSRARGSAMSCGCKLSLSSLVL